MSVFVITPELIQKIEALRKHAQLNVVDVRGHTPETPKNIKPVGDDPNFVIWNLDFKIVYSIERQMEDHYHHLSVSCSSFENRFPHPEVINEILRLFKFANRTNDINVTNVWREENSINVLAKMSFKEWGEMMDVQAGRSPLR
jgi:hypothetical protein